MITINNQIFELLTGLAEDTDGQVWEVRCEDGSIDVLNIPWSL